MPHYAQHLAEASNEGEKWDIKCRSMQVVWEGRGCSTGSNNARKKDRRTMAHHLGWMHKEKEVSEQQCNSLEANHIGVHDSEAQNQGKGLVASVPFCCTS